MLHAEGGTRAVRRRGIPSAFILQHSAFIIHVCVSRSAAATKVGRASGASRDSDCLSLVLDEVVGDVVFHRIGICVARRTSLIVIGRYIVRIKRLIRIRLAGNAHGAFTIGTT